MCNLSPGSYYSYFLLNFLGVSNFVSVFSSLNCLLKYNWINNQTDHHNLMIEAVNTSKTSANVYSLHDITSQKTAIVNCITNSVMNSV